MRNCANCGKANQPTRKYCIRCGRSLISKTPRKKKATQPVPEVGRVTTAETLRKQEEAAAAEVPKPVEEQDQWVKPSEVSKGRVRSTSGTKKMTELEKAQAAFAKAEEVGIEEETSGIVVTRMLRASEVKELMEGVSAMPTAEDTTGDEPMVGPPPIAAPSPQDLEEQILGSKSAFVDKPTVEPEPEPLPIALEETVVINPTETPVSLASNIRNSITGFALGMLDDSQSSIATITDVLSGLSNMVFLTGKNIILDTLNFLGILL